MPILMEEIIMNNTNLKLTLTEELELGKLIQAGITASTIASLNGMTPELEVAISNGDAARNKLFEANVGFALSEARKYLNKGVPFDDLKQAALSGLWYATSKYNPEMGNKFSTYAVNWIKEYIVKELASTASHIRIPDYKEDMIRAYKKTAASLFYKLGYEPSVEEIAKEMNISIADVCNLIDCIKLKSKVSLEKPVGDDESTLADFVSNDDLTPSQSFYKKKLTTTLNDILAKNLDERELMVIKEYSGYGDKDPSFTEIGKKINVSRERARQIYIGAILKLQNCSQIGELKELWSLGSI